MRNRVKDKTIYMAAMRAIFSMVTPLSINNPKSAVPKAVEKTIKAVVRDLIAPICFTP